MAMQPDSKEGLRRQIKVLDGQVDLLSEQIVLLDNQNKYLEQCVENQKGSIQYMADKRKPLLEVIGTLSDLLLEK